MTEPWLDRWREGRTGWHEPSGNRNLKAHWRLSGRRVLVPLCGKTPDLLWLEKQGNAVVGVELSDIAALAFFAEELQSYWPGLRRYASIDDTVNAPPKFLAAGLARMGEVVWIR
jgi:thiopurine S-methyltransferase